MKNIIVVGVLIMTSLLGSCRKKSTNCGLECTQNEELLFNFGFEDVLLSQNDNRAEISGIDAGYTSNNNWNEWNSTADNPAGTISIYYEDGDISQRTAELTSDPLDASNQVLHYKINSTNVSKNNKPSKSRIQMELHDTECIKEYYQTVKIMLPSSMTILEDYPDKIHWLSIFEFWNNGNWTNEKYPFRITVGLNKISTASDNLHLKVDAQTFKKPNNFKTIWEETATSFDIPFDQWMELELYVLEGDESNGRFYLAVTPDGSAKQVLFDINNTTQHPKEKCPDGFTHIHPLKWYTSHELTDFAKGEGESLEIYWDDWRVWRNKTP